VPSAVQIVNESWNQGLKPPPILSVSAWADRYRFVAAPSPQPGEWRTERTPYLRGIMDCLSPTSSARTVAMMKASQLGATEAALNWIGYKMHQYPSSFLIVLPTQGVAEEWSKTRLDQMMEHSPALKDLIAPAKSRDSGNTIFNKKISGGRGFIKFAWSSSAAKQRSTPAGDLVLDEVDGFEGDAEGEGDPVTSLKNRFKNFPRGKMLMISTPVGASTSRISREFKAGDQRVYFVPCPHCGHYQKISFSRLKWPKRRDDETRKDREARYEMAGLLCVGCNELISERYKGRMLSAGIWVATATKPELAETGFAKADLPSLEPIFRTMEEERWVSFHLPATYSPLGWYSWATMAADWEAAQGQNNRTALKVFVMQALGEVWEDEPGEVMDDEVLWLRHEKYEPGVVPARGLFLTAFVDVQKYSLHFELKAWGRGKENWSVFYQVIQCETDGPNPKPLESSSPELWDALDELLARDWQHESGVSMPIMVMGIDTGFSASTVYEYAARHPRPHHDDPTNFTRITNVRTVACTKGEPDNLKLIHSVTKTEAARDRGGLRIWHIGTGFAKQEFYDALKIVPLEGGIPQSGRCHYPYPEREFYRQVCSESRKVSKGKVYWERDPAVRNEPVDTHVGNRAMASLCGIDGRITEAEWDGLEKRYGVTQPKVPVMAVAVVSESEEPEAVTAPPEIERERIERTPWIQRRKGWLS
jgi:phage terminase large subunit GpA-like protein